MQSTNILHTDSRQEVKDSWSNELKSNSRFNIISAKIYTLSVYTDKMFHGNAIGNPDKHSLLRKQLITIQHVRKEIVTKKKKTAYGHISVKEIKNDIARQEEKFKFRQRFFVTGDQGQKCRGIFSTIQQFN